MYKTININPIFLAIQFVLLIAIATPTYGDTFLLSKRKTITFDDDGEATATNDIFDDIVGIKTNDFGKIRIKKSTLTKTVKGKPNTSVRGRHHINFDWDEDDERGPVRKITLVMAADFDFGLPEDDPNNTFTGFTIDDLPIIADAMLEIEGFGIFLPTNIMTASIFDVGTLSLVELYDDFVDPDASGFVPMVMWEVPEEAFSIIPEPASIGLFGAGLVGIGFLRRRVKRSERRRQEQA